MNYNLFLLPLCFQGALSRGQGVNTLPSPASIRHGKTLSFHDHVLKKTKDVPSGLQDNPAATTALAASQGGGLLDGSAGVRWMGADGGPVNEVEGDAVFAEERNSKAVTVQGRGLVGLEGDSGSSLPDGTAGERWMGVDASRRRATSNVCSASACKDPWCVDKYGEVPSDFSLTSVCQQGCVMYANPLSICQIEESVRESSCIAVCDEKLKNAPPFVKNSCKYGCQFWRPSPWEIIFVNLTADFAVDSNDELIVDYEIGKDRAHETSLYEKDCSTNITDITVNSTKSYTNKDLTHDTLTVKHSFDKSMIANSTIWNSTTSEIEICQVVRLIVPANGTDEKMVISEDKRVVAIDFDLSVDFEINNITLGAATIESGSGTTDVTSYVEACKCGGIDSFNCTTDDLVPNSELFVCIKSKSTDVKIDSLESMTITQGDEAMTVIAEERVVVPSISSRDYFPNDNVVVVSTRVPVNLFTYAEGQTITVSGDILMKLADGNRRKLQTDIVGGGAKFDANKKAPFQLMIGLQDEMVLEGESYVSSATGVASASKDVGMLVMVFASTYIML